MARKTIANIEEQLGRSIVSRSNAKNLQTPEEFANDISRRNLIMFNINHQDKVLLGTDMSVRDVFAKPYIVNIEDFDVNILKRMHYHRLQGA